MKLLTIKNLMIAGPVFVVVLLLVSFFFTRDQLHEIDELVEHQSVLAEGILAIKDARVYLVQIQQFLTDVAATGEEDAFSEAEESLAGVKNSLNKMIEVMPEHKQMAGKIALETQALYQLGRTMAMVYIKEGREAGNALMKRQGDGFDDTSARLSDLLKKMSAMLQSDYDAATQQAEEGLHDSASAITWSSLAIALAVTVVMLLLYWRTMPPLRALRQSMTDIAAGDRDLTVRLEVGEVDEIGEIRAAFNRFVTSIHNVLQSLDGTTAELAAEEERRSGRAVENLSRLEMLQQETEQVATAINEMSMTVQEVSRNTELTAEATHKADGLAHQGAEVVNETARAISGLAQEVERASGVINRLETDSNEIGAVLDVIRGIAEQTNLLALNAAIEAARAGEQGRGFAVVADEVRNLAGRTQSATEEIRAMIEKLQQAASEAVSVMASGRSQAEQGVELTNRTQAALGEIAESIASISGMSAQIATAANQQSSVADEINGNVSRIVEESNTVSSNAKTAGEVAAQVRQKVGAVRDLIGHFKL